MDFFEEHKKQILIVSIIALLTISIATMGKKTDGTIFNSALSFIVTPFQKLTTKTGNFFQDIKTSLSDNSAIAEENELLKDTIASLEAENKRLMLQGEQNKRLSALLDIAQRYQAYETTGTQIIAKDPGSFYDVFLIDKGSDAGIKANMVLMEGGGLVGRIVESSLGFSRAESILDSRSSVPAMSVRTNDLGVVRGDYSLMNDGLCIMEYIDAEAEIIVGDEIVTSYLSNIYPPGIVIGTVKEIASDSNGLTKYAVIEPHVDFKRLDTLLILDNDSNKEAAK